MASLSETVTVAVERAAHDGVRELVRILWEEHGIILKSARISWIDVSTASEPKMLINDIELETITKAGSK